MLKNYKKIKNENKRINLFKQIKLSTNVITVYIND